MLRNLWLLIVAMLLLAGLTTSNTEVPAVPLFYANLAIRPPETGLIRAALTAGQQVGQMPATNSPTCFSISATSPTSATGYFAIDCSGNITVTTAGATALTGQTGTVVLTVTAQNAAGVSGPASATINYSPAAVTGFVWNASGSNASGYTVGMNISEFPAGYPNGMPMFADISRQFSGNFGSWDNGSNTAAPPGGLDPTGAPLGCATSCNAGFPNNYPSGTYTLTWTGTGNITLNAGTRSGVTVTNPGVNQLNTATWTYTQVTNAPGGFVTITATPPVTDIHLIAPSNLTVGTCYNNPCFLISTLQKMSPFNPFRFMAALNENNQQSSPGVYEGDNVVNWAQRSWPPGASGTFNMGVGNSNSNLTTGFVYEDMIAYANTTGKDVWVNIPLAATDNFVCRLARLFRFGESGAGDNGTNCSLTAAATAPFSTPPLNSTSHVYIEYANEEWNDGYPARQQAMCYFNGVGENGNTCGTFGGGTWLQTSPSNILNAAMANSSLPWSNFSPKNTTNFGVLPQVEAVLNYRNKSIFSQIYAISPAGTAGQVRVVLNLQGGCGNPGCSTTLLTPAVQFLNAYVGSYTLGIDYVVVAPYINVASCTSTGDACAQSIDAATKSGGNGFLSVQGDVAGAATASLPMISYEAGDNMIDCGVGNVPAFSSQFMFTAMSDMVKTMWGSQVGATKAITFCCSISSGSLPTTGTSPGCNNGHPWVSLVQITDAGSQVYDGMISTVLIPGDANMDGVVDQKDCAIVNANFGLAKGAAPTNNSDQIGWGFFWSQGDFNHDGTVGADDKTIMNQFISGGAC